MYKIKVSISGENFFWIVVGMGKIIRNPTKEELDNAKYKTYNTTNICYRCREENNIIDRSILYPAGNACRAVLMKDGSVNCIT